MKTLFTIFIICVVFSNPLMPIPQYILDELHIKVTFDYFKKQKTKL